MHMGTAARPSTLSFLDRLRITQGLDASTLPCGCSVGRYLTYRDEILSIVDEARGCPEGHVLHQVIERVGRQAG